MRIELEAAICKSMRGGKGAVATDSESDKTGWKKRCKLYFLIAKLSSHHGSNEGPDHLQSSPPRAEHPRSSPPPQPKVKRSSPLDSFDSVHTRKHHSHQQSNRAPPPPIEYMYTMIRSTDEKYHAPN
jgi:hypothetical protein